MLKKTTLLFTLCSILLFAEISPKNVLGSNCLKSYENSYQTHPTFKAFSYARENETGKDRCGWAYGHKTLEKAQKAAMKQCTEHPLNAECRIVDNNGKFQVKKGNFSLIEPVNHSPLTKKEIKDLKEEAKKLLQGNCLPFFDEYIKSEGHKAFAYALDADGKFACGRTYRNNTPKIAKLGAINGCKTNKTKRGNKTPKSACKIYAEGKHILLNAKSYNVVVTEKSHQSLDKDAFKMHMKEAKEIIEEGPCLYQMKYYLRDDDHKAYYLAGDNNGTQACGTAEDAFSIQSAKAEALKKCQAYAKKKHIQAKCMPYMENLKVVGKPKDFGILHGKKDYKYAIYKGNLSKINKYLSKGLDINTVSIDGTSPIFIVAGRGDEVLFNAYIKKGANIHQKTKDGSTLLIAALFGANPNIIRYLINKGFDVNTKTFEGNTPLHIAFKQYNSYIIEMLMQEGADASIKNDKGITGYDLAKKEKINLDDLKTMSITRKKDGCTQVFYAAQKGDKEGLEKLAKLKANINISCEDGIPTLAYAQDNAQIIKLLVKLGAKINEADSYGDTPLMYAASAGLYGELEKVQTLLALGADKSIKNKKGKTAYDMIKDEASINPKIKALVKLK